MNLKMTFMLILLVGVIAERTNDEVFGIAQQSVSEIQVMQNQLMNDTAQIKAEIKLSHDAMAEMELQEKQWIQERTNPLTQNILAIIAVVVMTAYIGMRKTEGR